MFSRALNAGVIILLIGVAIQIVSSTDEHLIGEYEGTNHFDGHNLRVGKREDGDKLLQCKKVIHGRKWFRHVNLDFKFPESEGYDGALTLIEIFDVVPKGKGGYAEITEGGPGKESVTIHLRSRWFRGISFIICVYGF